MRYGIDAKPFDWPDEITAEAKNLNHCGVPDLPKVI
jgi:hypothetical protein